MKLTDTRALTPRPAVVTKLEPNYWPSAQAVLDEHRELAGMEESRSMELATAIVGAVLLVVAGMLAWVIL